MTFRRHTIGDHAAIESLVRQHISDMSDWSLSDDHGALLALDRDQAIMGVLVASASQHPRGVALYIQHLVVRPDSRGRGVGVVLLGMCPQLLPGTPLAMTWGQCEAGAAGYYERAGFTVLAPDETLPFVLADRPALLANSNPTYNCWFYR